jgi:hypothetical protein
VQLIKVVLGSSLGMLIASLGFAQETQLGAEFRMEGERFTENCGNVQKLIGCGQVLFTDQPLHIAVGSLAPQNGVGFGGAFLGHWTPSESWRLNYDMDAVASTNGSWRAGAYFTAVLDKRRGLVVLPGGSAAAGAANVKVQEFPVFHAYAQATSLNKLTYFGIGPDSSDISRTYYGMRETIAGVNGVWPVWKQFNVSLYGEANGRFVDIRGRLGESSPSIEQRFNPITAPGLNDQPAFAQFGEGIRIRPSFAGGHINLNYLGTFQEYVASGNSRFSFQRYTIDLSHEFPLYRTSRSFRPLDSNGPDDCSTGVTQHTCPSVSRNREGSFSIQLIMNGSFVPTGHVVPFYLMPTLGGSDINGNPTLPSYQDYRFRAPNTLLARATFEHSIYGPLGFIGMVDEGKVAMDRSDLNFTHLLHSYSVGLTMRAGGFPLVSLLFSFGGHEGTHTTARINGSLLGGSARPSLY